MELSDEARARLASIKLAHEYSTHRPKEFNTRPKTDALYEQKKRKIAALRKAWASLDEDTRWDVVGGIKLMWDDAESAVGELPDIEPLLNRLLEEMKKAPHGPEHIEGFNEATMILWGAWVASNHGDGVPYGAEMSIAAGAAAISERLAAIFDITPAEAEKRAKTTLHSREKARPIAGRK